MPAIGTKLGSYEIVAPLASSVTGEAFRARDTRADRPVTLKLLRSAPVQDDDRFSRFEHEARTAGALGHPNVAAVHDIGTAGEVPFVVTEPLEGSTLRARLRRGALPVREAVDIAWQVAQGLAAAHDRGLVHGTIDPDTVFLTRDGQVKLLDFGLGALADDDSGPASRLPGLSPEQVRGEPVDARTDIFALGGLLYEMLSGRRAFGGATLQDATAAIVYDHPPELSTPPVSPGLVHLVRRCLEKRPQHRFQCARDLALGLEVVASGHGPPAPAAPAARSFRWLALTVPPLAAALGALAMYLVTPTAPGDGPLLRYEVHSGADSSPAVSPDGRTLAFTSSRDGTRRIWLRDDTAREIPLTDGPDDHARFHPDGRSVLFIRDERDGPAAYRQALDGGRAERLAAGVAGGDWSPDGRRMVLLQRQDHAANPPRTRVVLAGADGGLLERLAVVPGTLTHPRWSPDGTRIAAVEYGVEDVFPRVALVSVADGSTRLLETPLLRRRLSAPAWLAGSRRIAYAQAESVTADHAGSAGRLFAQDVDTGATRMLLWSPVSAGVLDVANDGSLVWDGASARANIRLLDAEEAAAGERWVTRGESHDRQPVFTPDGASVIFASNRGGDMDLWSVSLASGRTRRLTEDGADDRHPAVTDDGRLVWSSTRTGRFEIWTAAADGTGARQLTHDGMEAASPAVTRNGWVVYSSSDPRKEGLWKIALDGSGTTQLVHRRVLAPAVSPDGQHVAAVVPGRVSRIQVWRVADGVEVPFAIVLPDGRAPAAGGLRWMPDGRRLAFLTTDATGHGSLYVQDFVPDEDTTGTRRRLAGDRPIDSFAISPDGTAMALAEPERWQSILRADGVEGILRPDNETR